MYRDDQEISLDFKAVSEHPLLKEDSVFLGLRNPDPNFFKGLDTRMLPIIGVIKKLNPDFEEGNIEQQHISAALKFDNLLGEVCTHAGRREEYIEWKHGNSNARKAKVERNFGEITSNKDFDARCLSYSKACAIAMLPATQQIEYEKKNYADHIEALEDLDRQAKQASQPMFYSWINVTCHPEALKFFNIDQF